MSENSKTNSKKSTKNSNSKTVKKEKEKTESAVKRNSKGQFEKGESGNPSGRPRLSEELKNFASKSPQKLWDIANSASAGPRLKSDILMWFCEMYYGKPRQQVDLDAEQSIKGNFPTVIAFEGELDKWSK